MLARYSNDRFRATPHRVINRSDRSRYACPFFLGPNHDVVVEPVPNYNREPTFSWDAYFDVPDPDGLAAEFAARGVPFAVPLSEGDGLRGFVIEDLDGSGLYFGCVRE